LPTSLASLIPITHLRNPPMPTALRAVFTQIYGFQANPFSRTLNTQDVLATPGVKELQARLTLAVRERGIALVTGDVGSGKSTAVRAFIASLDHNRHVVLYLTLPIASSSALYRQLLMLLNQPVPFGSTAVIPAKAGTPPSAPCSPISFRPSAKRL
jgi:type II secretory pathway predicted ATPase ExeA